MKKPKPPTHGGARAGSGRPKKEPTKTLSYRVPEKYAKHIDEALRLALEGLINGKGATIVSNLDGIIATRKCKKGGVPYFDDSDIKRQQQKTILLATRYGSEAKPGI